MENEDYITLEDMTELWTNAGKQEAEKYFKKYQDGEITKQQLADLCWLSKIYAALADYEGQCKGAGFLYKMEELGFIKNLHRVD